MLDHRIITFNLDQMQGENNDLLKCIDYLLELKVP